MSDNKKKSKYFIKMTTFTKATTQTGVARGTKNACGSGVTSCPAGEAISAYNKCGFLNLGETTVNCSKGYSPVCGEGYVNAVNLDVTLTGVKSLNNGSEKADVFDALCEFRTTAFTSLTDVDIYINTFSRDDNYKNEFMPVFCAQTSSSCPADTTGTPMTSCNFINDTGDSGKECKTWVSTVGSGADATMQNYCGANPNAADCNCLNRSLDPVYQAVKAHAQSSGIPDQCWWAPCSSSIGSTGQLVTTALADLSVCPSTVCDTINEIIGNTNSNITEGDVSSTINCTGTPSPGSNNDSDNGGSTPVIPVEPSTPSVDPTDNTFSNTATTFWDKYKLWIFIAIGVFFVILLLIFVIVHNSQSKKKSKTSTSTNTSAKTTSTKPTASGTAKTT